MRGYNLGPTRPCWLMCSAWCPVDIRGSCSTRRHQANHYAGFQWAPHDSISQAHPLSFLVCFSRSSMHISGRPPRTRENLRLERLSIEFHGAIPYPRGPPELMSGGSGEPCRGGSSYNIHNMSCRLPFSPPKPRNLSKPQETILRTEVSTRETKLWKVANKPQWGKLFRPYGLARIYLWPIAHATGTGSVGKPSHRQGGDKTKGIFPSVH